MFRATHEDDELEKSSVEKLVVVALGDTVYN